MRKNIQIFLVLMISINLFLLASPTYGGSNFTGPYEMQNWSVTATGGRTATITPSTGSATSANFEYNIDLRDPVTGRGSGVSFRTWTFSTTAASTGPATFDWQYDFDHAWFDVEAVFQTYAMTSDGRVTTTELYFSNLEYTGHRSFNGTATINVEEGRPFGFIIGGSNFDWSSWLDGTLTITNFEYPPVPIQGTFFENITSIESSGPYQWKSEYDISYSDQAVTVNLDIQLNWDDPEDPLRNLREQQWKEGIEDIWGDSGFKISDGTFDYSIIFEVNWVDVDPHQIVNVHSVCFELTADSLQALIDDEVPNDIVMKLFQSNLYNKEFCGGNAENEFLEAVQSVIGAANTATYKEYILEHAEQIGYVNIYNWYTQKPSGWSNEWQDEIAAHEAGHMFGLYDEYDGGALDPDTFIIDEDSIMGKNLGQPRERHYQGILAWLDDRSNSDLFLVPPSAPPGLPPSEPRPDIDFRDPMPPVTETPIPESSTVVLVAFGLLAGISMIKKYRRKK